ncbi:peroxiredoxin AhpE [Gordonia jinhuaensis]|uniref:Alkyl hydroperoxide reductase E n=1 Tax=Gordonia jinhuaensis TaxID=1517702 RepID=A0A916WNT4_9ACTN|nr:peroxiredoxin [Gordonia jinhuaensis]GGB18428.1 putative peroxiredoxin [Gordonia jinhuaensis]
MSSGSPTLDDGPLQPGTAAPDFVLMNQDNRPIRLSDFRGTKNVLLVFFPMAFTGNCEGELGMIRDNLPKFSNDDTELLTISVGSPPTHKVWSGMQGYLFPLLSDFWPHGEVAQRYGVFDHDRGYAMRGTFLVDRDGIITFSEAHPSSDPRDQSLWEKALAALSS